MPKKRYLVEIILKSATFINNLNIPKSMENPSIDKLL